jgi:hypothetical protein
LAPAVIAHINPAAPAPRMIASYCNGAIIQ